MQPIGITIIFCLVSYTYSADWGYKAGDPKKLEPKDWEKHFPKCAGKKQSPINIATNSALITNLPKIILGQGWSILLENGELSLSNNGHTAKVSIETSTPITTMKGGTKWILDQFHLHWGKDSRSGSEHTINGRSFPAEIHFVHFNSKYPTIGDAVPEADGLLVLGFFIKVQKDAIVPSILQNLFTAFDDITFEEQKIKLDFGGRALGDMLTPKATSKYFNYAGSLTTPTCDESVNWNVMSTDNAIVVTEEQMMQLRKLSTSMANKAFESMSGNFRPIQPLNGRIVRRNFRTTTTRFSSLLKFYFPKIFRYFRVVPRFQ